MKIEKQRRSIFKKKLGKREEKGAGKKEGEGGGGGNRVSRELLTVQRPNELRRS